MNSVRSQSVMIAVATLSALFMQKSLAEPNDPTLAKSWKSSGENLLTQVQNWKQESLETPLISRARSWDEVFEYWKNQEEKEPPLVTRGDFCPISPRFRWFGKTNVIWSDRPLFIWIGNIQKVEVIFLETAGVVWSQEVPVNKTSIAYTGEALQPGERYALRLWSNSSPVIDLNFQIMETEQRQQIAADLRVLENELKAEGNNQEEIALQRANYFVHYNLWSDVLQEIYSVENPSSELNKISEKITDLICINY